VQEGRKLLELKMDTMELHAHTHASDPDIHRSRKKWTHYLWEFLMLFLAVSLGFLVENQREHLVERQRAKVYANNLFEDLKNDTIRLNHVIGKELSIAHQLDTFCQLVRDKNQQAVTSGMLYYYASSVTLVEYFSPNNATIEELKGSGNLRIMGNELANKISQYDKMNRELEKEYSLSRTEFAKMEDLHFKIFDLYLSETLFPEDELKYKTKDSIFALTNLPIKNDPEMMKEYTGWLKFESDIYL